MLRWSCAALLLVSLAAPVNAAAQDSVDTVRLRNGGIVRGEVVVFVPGVRVSIRADGEVYVFEAADIESVEIGGDAVAGAEPSPESPPTTVDPEAATSTPEPTVAPEAPATTDAEPSAEEATTEPAASPEPTALPNLREDELRAERAELVRSLNSGSSASYLVGGGIIMLAGIILAARSSKNHEDSIDPPFRGQGCERDCEWSGGMALGVGFAGVGFLSMIVGLVTASRRGKKRARIRQRIRAIDEELQASTDFGWHLAITERHQGVVLHGTF